MLTFFSIFSFFLNRKTHSGHFDFHNLQLLKFSLYQKTFFIKIILNWFLFIQNWRMDTSSKSAMKKLWGNKREILMGSRLPPENLIVTFIVKSLESIGLQKSAK